MKLFLLCLACFCVGGLFGVFFMAMFAAQRRDDDVPAEVESPSPKPTDPVPIRDVYYVMTECDSKTGTVKYEPRERIEP